MTYKEQYKKMYDRLNQLFAEGNGDGYEADVLRNEMDGPWYKMSEEDKIEIRKYASEQEYKTASVKETDIKNEPRNDE